jgi:hypothetical protein
MASRLLDRRVSPVTEYTADSSPGNGSKADIFGRGGERSRSALFEERYDRVNQDDPADRGHDSTPSAASNEFAGTPPIAARCRSALSVAV